MSKISDLRLNPSAFSNMPKLRVLKFFNSNRLHINEVHGPQALETYFPELRYLMWHGCPIKSPLMTFYLENLVKLDMSYIKVKQLWNGCQVCFQIYICIVCVPFFLLILYKVLICIDFVFCIFGTYSHLLS